MIDELIEKHLDYIETVDPNFYKRVQHIGRQTYENHLKIMCKKLSDWRVMENKNQRTVDIVCNLVSFHGLSAELLPEHLTQDSSFMRIYSDLRIIIEYHDGIITAPHFDFQFREIQEQISTLIKKHSFSLVLPIVVSDVVSALCQYRERSNCRKRIKYCAKLFLEVYAPKLLELGFVRLSREYSNISFRIINPTSARQLTNICHPLTIHIEEELNQYFTEAEIIYDKCYFKSFSISNMAKKLGILYEHDGEIISTIGLYDIGRIVCQVPDKESMYKVLGAVMEKYPAEERVIKDYTIFPKPSGYKAIHLELPVWIRMNPQRILSLASPFDSNSQVYLIKMAIVLPEGSAALNEDDMSHWDKTVRMVNENHILIRTPKNQKFRLPVGSSVLDLAFLIHTELGGACQGAYIKRETDPSGDTIFYPRQAKLQNNDVVEIVHPKSQEKIDMTWLEDCKTTRAKQGILRIIRQQNAHVRARKAMPSIDYYVDVEIRAIDERGLTQKIAKVFCDFGLYALHFYGTAFYNGRAKFRILLLLTESERQIFVVQNRLAETYKKISAVDYFNCLEWSISSMAQDNMVLDSPGDWRSKLRDVAFFSGRENEMLKLKKWFNHRIESPCCALLGFFRAGKTILSNQFSIGLENTLTIHINCTLVDIDSLSSFWESLTNLLVLGYGEQSNRLNDDILSSIDNPKLKFLKTCKNICRRSCNNGYTKVLIIIDDIDSIKECESFLSIDNFVKFLSKDMVDEIGFAGADRLAAKILLIGQYETYRLLKKIDDTTQSPVTIINVKRRFIDEFNSPTPDGKRYIEKRFYYYLRKNPHLKFIEHGIKRILKVVGPIPQMLSLFTDEFLYRIPEVDTDQIKEKPSIVHQVCDEIENDIKSIRRIRLDYIRAVHEHYLSDKNNDTIRQLLQYFALRKGKPIHEEKFFARVKDKDLIKRCCDELDDFGFILWKNNNQRLWMPEDLTSQCIRAQLESPEMELCIFKEEMKGY